MAERLNRIQMAWNSLLILLLVVVLALHVNTRIQTIIETKPVIPDMIITTELASIIDWYPERVLILVLMDESKS
jgi:hypothetical protein